MGKINPHKIHNAKWDTGMVRGSGIPQQCPICNEAISHDDMGIHSHLRMHVRKGELKQEDFRATKEKLNPVTIRDR